MTSARTRIIAEAGVNHDGSIERALKLVDAAADAGADMVKFQSFKAESVASRSAPKAAYQRADRSESQLAMLRRLELSEADHERLVAHCAARGIGFLSTPFDLDSLRLLVERFGLDTIKVGSGEITNAPLLLAIASAGRNVLLSTGMATLGDIEAALGVLAFGYACCDEKPSRAGFAQAYVAPECRALLAGKVALLHCTTEYPAPVAEVNLRAIDTLKAAFGLEVGFSDHTPGIAIPLAAVARGATLVEKHFTLDRTLEGPDHRASLEPAELAAMVAGIRQVEEALGDGRKVPSPSEQKNIAVVRKSLVAARAIAAGERFSERNLATKRPGTGLSPFDYWTLLGTPAPRPFEADEPLTP